MCYEECRRTASIFRATVFSFLLLLSVTRFCVPWQRFDSIVALNVAVTPPAQRVQFILGEDVDDGMHEPHPLFAEMGELVHDGNDMEWKETAR
jgi:hypothetical protein